MVIMRHHMKYEGPLQAIDLDKAKSNAAAQGVV
jgi:hypothetical protein